MPKWTVEEIAKATSGTVHHAKGQETVGGVSFDTRKIKGGNLFVPLIAERNGHEFIQSAIEKGAVAAFWSEPLEEAPKNIAIIQVKDTLIAFQAFANYYLNKINPKVIGVTGSNGKTTTKDMVAAIVSAKYKTHKTVGNFNNEIGLPLTILEMDEATEAIVLEMGMSGKGEIQELSHIAQPDIAVITMIGESHIEFLGSREAIAEAKLEIIEGMQEGTLVYSGEEPLLKERVEKPETNRFLSKKRTFGRSAESELYPIKVEAKLKETHFTTNRTPELTCILPIPGIYNVQNALAALLVGEELGIEVPEAYEQLSHFELTKNRLEWKPGWNGSTLLNDAYNASPSSMKAVLRYFQDITVPKRKVVVLGDVLELGDQSKDMHRSIREAIDPEKLDQLVLYGEEMTVLYDELKPAMTEKSLRHFKGEKEPLIAFLKDFLQPKDTVLLKSSFSTGLLEVVSKLSQGEKE
ncbi:UDP-N-acetylmuramoyl-tripeptide--D-alanyl-D-alanine ligase [Alkalibacterium iburiense]|uniref:UDP-N-acetylmuramoyl-tripeptide--D-alanyl-D-alanine ligase n=1 Tax=Alkalibacterium iburiense TaxID=290589 RepID=A0ABP3H6K4_9LACT